MDTAASEKRVNDLTAAMSIDEKVALMSGDTPLIAGTLEMQRRYNARPLVAGAIDRLGLEGVRFTDGPRGVVMYHSTAFPSPMARAATFDPTLEEAIGDAIGVEARTQGANLFAGVCINLLRHPAWGRAQETYGEDNHLLGEMGAALVRGTQRHVMACVKHFAVNSMENSRLWVDVRMDERDLRDIYLPHFRRCVDEGVASVMSAYNRVNGSRCGHSSHLLDDILKGEWGFDGFVMSDFFWGVRDARDAVLGGMDLEMPFTFRFRTLRRLVRRGRVPAERIDESVRRLVRAQVRHEDRGEPDRYAPDAVAGGAHRALAREAAGRSVVLLRNETVPRAQGGDAAPVLPIEPGTVRSVAVIGWLASAPNLGDLGSSQVHPPSVATVLDGLVAAGARHGIEVRSHDGKDRAAAGELAAACDVAIVVAGSSFHDEGEWILTAGGDRKSLRLKPHDERLVATVAAANPRTAVLLMGGSAFITDPWHDAVPALAMVWYPGMEGGHGIADVVFGRAPEGRLPCTWPASSNRLPPFRRFARRVTYGPLHGYRLMEAERQRPAFRFGFGLGYTTIDEGTVTVASVEAAHDDRRRITIRLPLTNTGSRTGVEVVQVYVAEVLGSYDRPLLTLRGFSKVDLEPGAMVTCEVELVVGPTVTALHVGRSSDPSALQRVELD